MTKPKPIPLQIPVVFFVFALAQIFVERAHGSLGWLFRTDAICFGVVIAFLQQLLGFQFAEPAFLRSRTRARAWLLIVGALLTTLDAPLVHFVQWTVGLTAILAAALVLPASFDYGYLVPAGRGEYGKFSCISGPARMACI
jgi:hypothetical protein